MRNGLKGTPAEALKDSEKYKALEVPRRATHKRTEGKKGDREDEVIFPPKEPAQPSGDRDDDGIGNQIRGDRPGGFINSCRKASADMIERDIDDRGIHDLNECRKHDCDGNNPPVHTHPRFI